MQHAQINFLNSCWTITPKSKMGTGLNFGTSWSQWSCQLSVIADQQAWGWLTHSTLCWHLRTVGTVSFCRGCESVRGHYLPSLIHAISCSLGSKNGNALYTVSSTLNMLWSIAWCDVCRRSPGRGGRPRLFSSIAELNSSSFPQLQDSNIYTSAHQHQYISVAVFRFAFICANVNIFYININIWTSAPICPHLCTGPHQHLQRSSKSDPDVDNLFCWNPKKHPIFF